MHKNILYQLKNLISLFVLKLFGHTDSKLIQTDLSFGKLSIIFLIRIYQLFSACFPAKCRFYPTCSNYMIHSITRYGLIKGSFTGTIRICKCHPFHPGGYDPVK